LWTKAAISSLNPIRTKEKVRKGRLPIINGIRRPHFVRRRSLQMLMVGVIVKLKTAGTLVMMRLISVPDAPMLFILRGIILGTTVSMMVKQKSPQSIHANMATSPRFV
jgi:hypothetical protein